MKDHFKRLFNYDYFINLQMTKMIIAVGNPERPVQLMAHLLAAQQVWLTRINEEPAGNVVLWPDWEADTFVKTIENNYKEWTDVLDRTSPGDFDKLVRYKNTKGDSFENKLSDILAHVINHGTHHRAQIGQLLKSTGVNLPPTDYIAYIRLAEQNK